MHPICRVGNRTLSRSEKIGENRNRRFFRLSRSETIAIGVLFGYRNRRPSRSEISDNCDYRNRVTESPIVFRFSPIFFIFYKHSSLQLFTLSVLFLVHVCHVYAPGLTNPMDLIPWTNFFANWCICCLPLPE